MVRISSTHNPRIKQALKLRAGRGRRKQGRIMIDGTRELSVAVAGGMNVIELFICPKLYQGDLCERLVAQLTGKAEITEVTVEVFERLAYGERAEGIVAIAAPAETGLANLKLAHPQQPPLVAVIEAIEKPGNLGAVVRTADAAGLSAVIAADPRTDLYNPNAIRASLGTVFSMPLAAGTAEEVKRYLIDSGVAICAARPDATCSLWQFDFTRPAAIVLGSEAEGLSEVWSGPEVTPVVVPMAGRADSLNVSATAAVLFYEARRQRAALQGG